MEKLAARARGEEAGFTLIELMVVVLIIGILIAIAVPTFLGARVRAQDRAAQASLRNALVAAKVAYTDEGTYASATTSGLGSIEPSLHWTVATVAVTDGPNLISITPGGYTVNGMASAGWAAAVMSQSGTCFWIADRTIVGSPSPGTFYGETTDPSKCDGTSAEGANSPTAQGGW